MKTTPFNNDFVIDQFELTFDLFIKGYVILSKIPIIETMKVFVEDSNDILSTGYVVTEVDETNDFLYTDAKTGDYIITWIYDNSSSSSASPCVIIIYPQTITLFSVLEQSIGKTFQVRYILDSGTN